MRQMEKSARRKTISFSKTNLILSYNLRVENTGQIRGKKNAFLIIL